MSDLKAIVADLATKVEGFDDEQIKVVCRTMLNLIELLASENERLKTENQKLKDENNRLKGEQGKPNIRKQSQDKQDISSEVERKRKLRNEQKKSKKKKHKIKVNRVEVCDVDRAQLPHDAKFKGYQSTIVQDICITTNNVEFRKKIYYSPSLKQTFMASLPDGYHGEFGPTVKALILDLHYGSKMTESAICGFLRNHEIFISAATVSRLITDNHEDFHQEKQDIINAGMAATPHQQMDDTGARVSGKNHYTHILCNELYTAYFTRLKKDRITIIDILTQGEMKFRFNELSYALMEQMQLPSKQLDRLKANIEPAEMNRNQVDELLGRLFPDREKHTTNQRIILEASAIVAYQQLPYAIELLLTDDAPQFKRITNLLALCWIHDGRHYKKLNPIVPMHRVKLENFLTDYWVFYHKLLSYKERPTKDIALLLEKEFDTLFSTVTDYDQLDDRIKKTALKKESLLLVLQFPNLPLHNNASELGARAQARYRDISLHTINAKGTDAKDTFMTIIETAKKLTVNSYSYLYDRISKKYDMPFLANLINNKTKEVYSCDSC